MTRITAGRQAIDALSLKLTACSWLLAAVLLAGTSPSLCVVSTVVVAANLLVLVRFASGDQYIKRGRNLATWLRTAEAVLLCLSCTLPEVRAERFWMLALPAILTDYLVERSYQRVAAITFVVGATCWLCNDLQRGPLPYSWGPTLGCFATTIFAVMLAKYREVEERLFARHRRLSTLMSTANAVTDRDTDGTLAKGLEAAVNDLGAATGAVHLVSDDEPQQLKIASRCRVGSNLDMSDTAVLGQGLAGLAVSTRSPIVLHANRGEPLQCDGVALTARVGVSVPLVARIDQRAGGRYERKAIGALSLLFADDGDSVDEEDLALLTSLGSLMGAAVSSRLMEDRQRATFLQTMESLATALEARDDYTRGHSHRVCEVTQLVGQAFSLNPDLLEELRIGTILHDIGKIGVPDAILNKPGRLTDEEYRVMQQHPVIGFDICRPLKISPSILTIIRNHHEKLDGTGYPDKLTSESMPLPLRIVCVADAFDAMSSRRPYRGVLDVASVMTELNRCADSQFDSTVVEVLKELHSAGEFNELYREFWPQQNEKAA
jgi:putative nucleotidyltransferase with HDIG domain